MSGAGPRPSPAEGGRTTRVSRFSLKGLVLLWNSVYWSHFPSHTRKVIAFIIWLLRKYTPPFCFLGRSRSRHSVVYGAPTELRCCDAQPVNIHFRLHRKITRSVFLSPFYGRSHGRLPGPQRSVQNKDFHLPLPGSPAHNAASALPISVSALTLERSGGDISKNNRKNSGLSLHGGEHKIQGNEE